MIQVPSSKSFKGKSLLSYNQEKITLSSNYSNVHYHENNNNSSSLAFNSQHIQISGWLLTRESGRLKLWKRRYYALSGSYLACYNHENINYPKIEPREIFQLKDIHPLTCHDKGILITLQNDKTIKIIADTTITYSTWFSVLSNSIHKTKLDSKKTIHSSWIHYYSNDIPNIFHYYITMNHDVLNCYDKETCDQQLIWSGIIREVSPWKDNEMGLVIRLNKKRIIKILFSNVHEKTSWLLEIEHMLSLLLSSNDMDKHRTLSDASFNPSNSFSKTTFSLDNQNSTNNNNINHRIIDNNLEEEDLWI